MIHQAIYFAAVAHQNQKRKGTDVPYIVHPYEVAHILTKEGAEEEVVVAGLLHDTLEDTQVTVEDIQRQFGERVAMMVLGCSENKKDSWEERKRHTISYVKLHCPYEIMLIICADKLSNLRSIAEDYEEVGEQVWDRFHRGRDDQGWYYGGLVEALVPLEDLEMYQELCALYHEIFDI